MVEKSEDILGIKPFGEVLSTITKESIDIVKKFLETVCKPGAEEFGFIISDNIRVWRLNNIINIINKSNDKFEFDGENIQLKQIHPKLINKIFEYGSLESDDEVQNYWASLIGSSLDEYPTDDNVIYFEILKQLTRTELYLIQYFCSNSEILINDNGLKSSKKGLIINAEELFTIVNSKDVNKLNIEISHLKSLDLIEKGFGLASGFFEEDNILKVGLKMSPLAINLYNKCHI